MAPAAQDARRRRAPAALVIIGWLMLVALAAFGDGSWRLVALETVVLFFVVGRTIQLERRTQ